MTGVRRSKKRQQPTGEGNDDNLPVHGSPPKRTKKGTPEPKVPTPVQGRQRQESKIPEQDPPRTPSPIGHPPSSPLTTPKTPRAASKLGIPADVAKTMLKYASRLNPLVGLIYAVTQYFTEKQEDMPSREAFLPTLVDCVNSLVHTSCSYALQTLLLGHGHAGKKIVFSINARGHHVDVEF